MTARRERALPGPSFAGQSPERRPRIGGAVGESAGVLLPALERALGAGSRLVPQRALVVDADRCSIDGRPIESDDEWWRVLRSGSLARVEGAFAVAWLAEDGSLCLARDPIGHRSLYYAHSANTFAFASSVCALLDAGAVPRRIQLRSVAAFLSYGYVPGRQAVADGVLEVLPGEVVEFRHGVVESHRYWDLPGEPDRFESEEKLRHALRAGLEETLQGLLPREGPVAASLSGGIDSSLVVALATRFSPHPVSTFSITFGPDFKDELEWSSIVAGHCGTNHTIVELPARTVLAHLDDTVSCLDKPNGDPLTVPNALLFRAMAERARVVLNGEGGDPCFGGPKNLPMILSTLYGHGDEASHGDDPAVRGAQERSYLRAHLKAFDELSELLTEDAFALACTPPLECDLFPWFADDRWKALVSKLMAINTRFKGAHHILPKVDALSAPFGVVSRSPLFAKAIVELAFAIPPELKLRGTDEKYLLKRAVADLLPASILERPKSGMMVPVEAWFRGPLLPEARARILDGLAATKLFRRPHLEKLLTDKVGGLRPRRGVKLWLLVTLEAHLRALRLAG